MQHDCWRLEHGTCFLSVSGVLLGNTDLRSARTGAVGLHFSLSTVESNESYVLFGISFCAFRNYLETMSWSISIFALFLLGCSSREVERGRKRDSCFDRRGGVDQRTLAKPQEGGGRREEAHIHPTRPVTPEGLADQPNSISNGNQL